MWVAIDFRSKNWVAVLKHFGSTGVEVSNVMRSEKFFQERQWIFQNVREYDREDPLRWPRNTLYPQKLVLLRQEAAVARSA
jgi:hypothetical protein